MQTITRPLTLRWADVQSGLSVIYNCWDGCIRSTRLNKIAGSHPFYFLKKKGFRGINITFSVLGDMSRYQVLTPDDFASFGVSRWIPISLRRESTSLKVFIGYDEIKEITKINSTIVTEMEVDLMGEGSVTWCDLTTTSSNGLLIAVWTFAFGCFLLAIYSIATTVKSYKTLEEWKTNKEMGIKVNVLPPLENEYQVLRTPQSQRKDRV
ncbi:uncharacterized protein [Palaemon carinicauda]|uniref:uncharacterized protein n=1 Tax=Palaemon carinicauda TaxID=392227 RepID=UPI0035B630A9